MKFLITISAVLLLIGAGHAINVKFRDCGSQVGVVNTVSVEPCTAQPCRLQKGRNYTIGVTFTSAETTTKAHSKVYGTVFGVRVPFPLPQPDACLESGISCPIQNGQQYTYKASLPISTHYPSVKVIVEWDLMDHESGGNKLFCTQFAIALI